MRPITWLFAAAVLMLCDVRPTLSAPAEDVAAALAEMQTWVGDNANGRRWLRYLRTSELEDQLERGEGANATVVASLLARYSSPTPGLDRPKFTAVREALATWLAELEVPAALDLTAGVVAARESFRPITVEAVAESKTAVESRIEDLSEFLDSGPRGNADAWRKYLKWDDMQAELAKESVDLQALNRVLTLYYTNEVGLDLPQFVAVRQKLRRYMNFVYFNSDEETPQKYQAQLDRLSELVTAYQASPSTDDGLAIGRVLGWLDRADQAAELTSAARSHLSQSNLRLRMSERLVGAGVNNDVDRVNSVNESILGTAVRGTAHMTGSVGLDLVPSDDRAAFNIKMIGKVRSNTAGYNGPVTVYSTGTSNVWVEKMVFFDEFGLRSERARGRATASTNINSIAAPLPIIRRIAWNRARASKPQAERIAAGRTASRTSQQVNTQANEWLARANESYVEGFRKPLLRRNSLPRSIKLHSGEDELKFSMLHANQFQLAAPSAGPGFTGQCDLAVRIHESMIGNFSESLLGGKTLTNDELVSMLEGANMDVPAEVKGNDEEPPWSIRFAAEQPISARFDDGLATFTIRARRVVRGDNDIRKAISISAIYKFEQAGGGSKMIRQGDITVEYTGRTQLTPAEIAMKTILEKKFAALFEPEIVSDGLVLPGAWKKAGKLRLRELAADDGWLSLGWEQPPQNVRTANADTDEELN